MNQQYQIGTKPLLIATGMGILALPLILYGWLHLRRPPQTTQEQVLFQGITYKREFRSIPRPLMLHIVAIDLTAPGVKVKVTPGKPTPQKTEVPTEIDAQTTSEFLQEHQLQLAVNASFFYPFREVTPWDYYPKSGDRANVVGQAIANGSNYSNPESKFPTLCFNANNLAQISGSGQCPQGTLHAVAGNALLVERSNPVGLQAKTADSDKPYSRVAAALTQDGKKLWLIAVDGKQPFYSEGVTLAELTEIIRELDADWALNLDGGGSTTLVAATRKGASVLNSPTHTKLPLRERPIANHIGFYALPKKL
jgi:hypothetical protein